MTCFNIKSAIVCGPSKEYKPGDMPPKNDSYFDWNEWHEVQQKAGLRQQRCEGCGKYKYPQEMSKKTKKFEVSKTLKSERFFIDLEICKKCAEGESSDS